MEEQLPMISIITVNYNSTAITCELLESMKLLSYPHYEVIVSDMASDEDPSPALIQTGLNNLRILRSSSNLGFSGGNNLGASHALGSYLLFLNNDTVVSEGLLHKLIRPMINNASIGICSPRIKNYYDHTIEYAGFKPMNMITGRTSAIGFGEAENSQHRDSHETAGAHGCAMMMRRDVFETIGGFSADFFLYYEEWDLSTRIRKAGLSIWYEGGAEVLHKSSSTVGRNSLTKTYYLTRNRIYFMKRNATKKQFAAFKFYFMLFAAPAAFMKFILRNQLSHLKVFSKAVHWNFNTNHQPTSNKNIAGSVY